MPITQDRMLALIAAADDFARALRTAYAEVIHANERVRTAHADPAEELNNLTMLLSPNMLLHNPVDSQLAIEHERKHFKTVRGRNRASANWQRRKRERERNERPNIRELMEHTPPRGTQQQLIQNISFSTDDDEPSIVQPTIISRRTNFTDDPDALREASGQSARDELSETYVPLSGVIDGHDMTDEELKNFHIPDFEGEFKTEQQIACAQVDSTIGHVHEATLHDDMTISCSCGAVQRASRTIWNEHYHLTHDGEKVIR